MNAEAAQLKNYANKLTTIVEGKSDVHTSVDPTMVRDKKPIAQKTAKPVIKKSLTAGDLKKGKPVRSEEVIPFEKEGFKDF